MIYKKLKTIAKVFISSVVLVFSFYVLDVNTIKDAVIRLNPAIFAGAVFICLVHYVLMGIRWYGLIYKVENIPFTTHMKVYYYANFLNTITPANLGGDTYRMIALKEKAIPLTHTLTALIKERFIGLLSFLTFYQLIWGISYGLADKTVRDVPIYNMVGFTFLSVVLLFILITLLLKNYKFLFQHYLKNKLFEKIKQTIVSIHWETLPTFLNLLLLSMFILLLWLTMVKVVAYGLNISIAWLELGMIVILVELIRMIPVSIQGIGIRESMYAYFFGLNGLIPEDGFVLGGLSYLIVSVCLVLSGCMSFLIKTRSEKSYNDKYKKL